MLGTAQVFNVTHLLDYWYGVTWNASRRFMARWKETPEEIYRFAVQSFFEPTDFLRTLWDWILFYVEDGETRKSVLRQHQCRAVDLIVERCAEPDMRRGLIWHTQGSGKTFTLLTAARIILERKDEFQNPTAIVNQPEPTPRAAATPPTASAPVREAVGQPRGLPRSSGPFQDAVARNSAGNLGWRSGGYTPGQLR